jgi:hypothetical protein
MNRRELFKGFGTVLLFNTIKPYFGKPKKIYTGVDPAKGKDETVSIFNVEGLTVTFDGQPLEFGSGEIVVYNHDVETFPTISPDPWGHKTPEQVIKDIEEAAKQMSKFDSDIYNHKLMEFHGVSTGRSSMEKPNFTEIPKPLIIPGRGDGKYQTKFEQLYLLTPFTAEEEGT